MIGYSIISSSIRPSTFNFWHVDFGIFTITSVELGVVHLGLETCIPIVLVPGSIRSGALKLLTCCWPFPILLLSLV